MIIDASNFVKFNKIKVGDCFEYKGEFYIKMYPIELSINEEHNCRAFKLKHSKAWAFANDTIVTKVNMEVIIENE